MTARYAILLVKEREEEFPTYAQSIEQLGIQNQFRAVRNVEQLRKYIEGTGVYRNRELFPLPGLVLLDLDDKFSGLDVFLQWLRQSSVCRELRVIGLNSVQNQEHQRKLQEAGVNAFIMKTSSVPETLLLVRETEIVSGAMGAAPPPSAAAPAPGKRRSRRLISWVSDLFTAKKTVRRPKHG
jgi:hypothetical protein